jgi:predicted PurR-regulated permease PerM
MIARAMADVSVARPKEARAEAKRNVEPAKTDDETSFFQDDRLIVRFAALSCIFIGIITLTWVLFVAKPVIVPIVAAFVAGLIIAPIGERIQSAGISSSLANFIILACLIAGGFFIWYFLGTRLAAFVVDLPNQVQLIAEKVGGVLQSLDWLQSAVGKPASGTAENKSALAIDVKATALYIFGAVSPAITQILIFLFALVMFLIDRPLVKRAIVMAFRSRENRLEALRFVNQVEASLSRYLSTVFVINLGVGAATMALMFAIGMPGYIPLGIAAFFLNFLPFVGPLVLKVLLIPFGLAVFPTLAHGLLPVTIYALLILVESNFVTPVLVGRNFSMRPLAVFTSIVFWTWLWGLPGALLAMPILVIVATVIDRFLTEEKPSALPG